MTLPLVSVSGSNLEDISARIGSTSKPVLISESVTSPHGSSVAQVGGSFLTVVGEALIDRTTAPGATSEIVESVEAALSTLL